MANADTDAMTQELPEGWRPEEGSKVVGRITELSKGWSDFKGSFYPILVIDDEVSGERVSVHGFHFVLMDRLTALRPQVGERIGIKMGAKIPLKGNPSKSVQTYTVRIEGRSEDIWSEIDSPRATPSATQQPQQESLPVSTQSDDDIPF